MAVTDSSFERGVVFEPGIVLSTRHLGESDILLTLLGRARGKIVAVAKHGRTSKRRFFGSIDLFDCGNFEVKHSRNRSSLYLVHSISSRQSFPELRRDLRAFALASLCLEATDRFIAEEDPEGSNLFAPLFHSLRLLGEKSDLIQHRAVAAFYCLKLLKLSGYDILEDQVEIAPDARLWFTQMDQIDRPIAPIDKPLSVRGLRGLVRYMEETLGNSLKSSEFLPLTS